MNVREDFEEGMVVINTKTNKRGVVVGDPWNVCVPDEVPVQYDGKKGYDGTDYRHLCLFDLN